MQAGACVRAPHSCLQRQARLPPLPPGRSATSKRDSRSAPCGKRSSTLLAGRSSSDRSADGGADGAAGCGGGGAGASGGARSVAPAAACHNWRARAPPVSGGPADTPMHRTFLQAKGASLCGGAATWAARAGRRRGSPHVNERVLQHVEARGAAECAHSPNIDREFPARCCSCSAVGIAFLTETSSARRSEHHTTACCHAATRRRCVRRLLHAPAPHRCSGPPAARFTAERVRARQEATMHLM